MQQTFSTLLPPLGLAAGLAFAAGLALAARLESAPRSAWHACRIAFSRALSRARPWVLTRCRVPAVLLQAMEGVDVDLDGFALVDLHVAGAHLVGIEPVAASHRGAAHCTLDMQGRIILPRFVDAHAHPLKSGLIGRTRNLTHSPTGALSCETIDHVLWLSAAELKARSLAQRLDFALSCALQHGTKTLRAHLDGLQDGEPVLAAHVWAEFDAARARWLPQGLELQGVANLFLPMYAPADAAGLALVRDHVAETASRAGAVLGCYCPFSKTEPALLAEWLDALFGYARAQPRTAPLSPRAGPCSAALGRELDLDLHIDEHGDPDFEALVLPALCDALERARTRGYNGRVLLGHCTALCLGLPGSSAADDDKRRHLIERMASFGATLTVVANPLTNLALQDRQGTLAPIGQMDVSPRFGPRTPVWRGLTAVQELRAAGVRVAAASDNVRDWWFAYGDYDMLEVTSHAIRLAHLDSAGVTSAAKEGTAAPRAADWLAMTCRWPAEAICEKSDCALPLGQPLDMVAFDARSLSELLARPQSDRAVFVRGKLLDGVLPAFSELDKMNELLSGP